MTPDELDEAERLANAATEGPWRVAGSDGIYGPCPIVAAVTVPPDTTPLVYVTTEDAAFIAAARTLVPALIAEVRRLARELADTKRRWQRTAELASERHQIIEELHAALGDAHRPTVTERVIAERDAYAAVYGVAAQLRTSPVPLEDHLALVDAVDACRNTLESDDDA